METMQDYTRFESCFMFLLPCEKMNSVALNQSWWQSHICWLPIHRMTYIVKLSCFLRELEDVEILEFLADMCNFTGQSDAITFHPWFNNLVWEMSGKGVFGLKSPRLSLSSWGRWSRPLITSQFPFFFTSWYLREDAVSCSRHISSKRINCIIYQYHWK